MTTIDIIENRISLANKYLNILEKFKQYPINEIEKDFTLKGALERYLFLVIQSTIDLAEALISYKYLRKPNTYAESFEILLENKLINENEYEKLKKMCGFRNIITHDYTKINPEIMNAILHKNLQDIENFINKARNHI